MFYLGLLRPRIRCELSLFKLIDVWVLVELALDGLHVCEEDIALLVPALNR